MLFDTELTVRGTFGAGDCGSGRLRGEAKPFSATGMLAVHTASTEAFPTHKSL